MRGPEYPRRILVLRRIGGCISLRCFTVVFGGPSQRQPPGRAISAVPPDHCSTTETLKNFWDMGFVCLTVPLLCSLPVWESWPTIRLEDRSECYSRKHKAVGSFAGCDRVILTVRTSDSLLFAFSSEGIVIAVESIAKGKQQQLTLRLLSTKIRRRASC